MTYQTTPAWGDTFSGWRSVANTADVRCPLCNTSLYLAVWGLPNGSNGGAWGHEYGAVCHFRDLPWEFSHPFVKALIAKGIDGVEDYTERIAAIESVKEMFVIPYRAFGSSPSTEFASEHALV